MKSTAKYCAPERVSTGSPTCFTSSELKIIAKDLNNHVDDARQKVRLDQPKNKLHSDIRKRLESFCNEEHCWLEQSFLKHDHRKVLEKSFRPKKPRTWYNNPRTWLNTFDILHVMRQYERLHKDFAFLGVFPIDFRNHYSSGFCVGDSLCTFTVKEFLAKKKTHFGIVLNLDTHTMPGSHWVSVYCNLNPKRPNFGFYYYDSVSSPPGKEVVSFAREVEEEVKQLFPPKVAQKFVLDYNKVQKQFKNTECGVFSIVFLTQMLKQIDFAYVCAHMRKDDKINEIRDIIYRPQNGGRKNTLKANSA